MLELDDSLSVKSKYEERPRICNLGYLRTPFFKDGKVGYRCASEPVDDYCESALHTSKMRDAQSLELDEGRTWGQMDVQVDVQLMLGECVVSL